MADMAKHDLQVLGEDAIWKALERAGGRIRPAALELGISKSALAAALQGWARHLAPAAAELRARTGAVGAGRPPAVHVERGRFFEAWEGSNRNLTRCAEMLGTTRDVVRRLRDFYRAQKGSEGGRPPGGE